MSNRGKTRAWGSTHLVWQFTTNGSGSSGHDDIDTQDAASL
jgi:hypothetical protein